VQQPVIQRGFRNTTFPRKNIALGQALCEVRAELFDFVDRSVPMATQARASMRLAGPVQAAAEAPWAPCFTRSATSALLKSGVIDDRVVHQPDRQNTI